MLFTPKLHSCTSKTNGLIDKEDSTNGLLEKASSLLDKANGLLDREIRATCRRNGEESQLLF